MKEEQEATDLLGQQANNRLALFSFSMDDKYVPIMEIVKDVETALAVEAMYKESGRGKSTLAKYLTLIFQQELNQGSNKFIGGIFLLVCPQKLSTLSFMGKIWEDLSFGSQEFYPIHLDTSLDLYKRINIGNVRKQDVIKELLNPYKHVKYLLVTSQKNHLCSELIARVREEVEPNVEEVRQLLEEI